MKDLKYNNKSKTPIFLHLPIRSDSINDNEITEIKYDPKLTIPKPYGSEIIEKKLAGNPSPYCEGDNFEEVELENEVLVKSQKKKSISYKNMNGSNVVIHTALTDFSKKWPSCTNVFCWWCRHPFKNEPCSAPIYSTSENGIRMEGSFCSYNCALSYIVDQNTYLMWECASLLRTMHKKETASKERLLPAPHWKTLKSYGGELDIEKYRENFTIHRNKFRIMNWPYIPSNVYIEELNENKHVSITKKDRGYSISRNKPFYSSSNSLENLMKLRINQK